MLSQTAFEINLWIIALWLLAAAAYSFYAIAKDIIESKKDN